MTVSARIVAHSRQPGFPDLITLELRYPKFIHGEFLTHRNFSRNSSSSRAIPVSRLIQDVLDDPVIPTYWGRNQKGMEAASETDSPVSGMPREQRWLRARDAAVEAARAFADAGYHKQIVNRLIEPFCHIRTLVTATEWDNFFALRISPHAQPEIQVLARAMRTAIDESIPVLLQPGNWHMPYVTADEMLASEASSSWPPFGVRLSVARCARVSYLTHDLRPAIIEEDLALFNRLYESGHLSPFEHQALPEEPDSLRKDLWGNFRGWRQLRKYMEQHDDE